MSKDTIEQGVLVRRVIPIDGFVQHHDEEPIDRLLEEELAEVIGRQGRGHYAAQYLRNTSRTRKAARRLARCRTKDYRNRDRASQPASYTTLPLAPTSGAPHGRCSP